MATPKQLYYDKRGSILVQNLQSRHFGAYYCSTKEEALEKALSLIPENATVGWGGTMTALEVGLLEAIEKGPYQAVGRQMIDPDVFITGANGLSLDGQMVNIDGGGNRVGAILHGPKTVIVIAGMNKVEDTLEAAMNRARTIAAPMNQQRFLRKTPCTVTGVCADCKSEECICNQILITRNCRPVGRIQFVLVGEDLGF